MTGEELINTLCEATALPKELVSKELLEQIKSKGLNPKNMSLDDLRALLSEYLQDVILKAKKTYS